MDGNNLLQQEPVQHPKTVPTAPRSTESLPKRVVGRCCYNLQKPHVFCYNGDVGQTASDSNLIRNHTEPITLVLQECLYLCVH